MSTSEIINELPNLTEAERRTVLKKLRELVQQDQNLPAGDESGRGQAAGVDHRKEAAVDYRAVDLRSRGIEQAQAANLRARLKAFAEDWDRPEATIYDEDPAR